MSTDAPLALGAVLWAACACAVPVLVPATWLGDRRASLAWALVAIHLAEYAVVANALGVCAARGPVLVLLTYYALGLCLWFEPKRLVDFLARRAALIGLTSAACLALALPASTVWLKLSVAVLAGWSCAMQCRFWTGEWPLYRAHACCILFATGLLSWLLGFPFVAAALTALSALTLTAVLRHGPELSSHPT